MTAGRSKRNSGGLTAPSGRVLITLVILVLSLAGSAVAVVARASHRIKPWPHQVRAPLKSADAQAILGGVARAKASVARQRQAHGTPAAIRQRMAARSAYKHLSPAQAAALDAGTFHFRRSTWRPLTTARDGRAIRVFGRNAALVQMGRRRVLIRSVSPIVVPDGKRRPLVLSMAIKNTGKTFAPAHSTMSVSVSKDLRQGINLKQASVRPATDQAGRRAPKVVGDRIFFANTAPDTDFSVQPTPMGVETFWDLRSVRSPLDNSLDFKLRPGMYLRFSQNVPGGVEVMAGRAPQFFIPPPAIRDADGLAVKGHVQDPRTPPYRAHLSRPRRPLPARSRSLHLGPTRLLRQSYCRWGPERLLAWLWGMAPLRLPKQSRILSLSVARNEQCRTGRHEHNSHPKLFRLLVHRLWPRVSGGWHQPARYPIHRLHLAS